MSVPLSFNLTLNSSNVADASNSYYTFRFPQGNFYIPENAIISCTQATIPYSWRNILSTSGNNAFQYYIPTGSSGFSAYTVTVPDGFYTISDLNTYFQSVLFANGHYWYLTTSSQLNPTIIYPLSITTNKVLYTNSITSITIPTAANITSVFGANYAQAPNWSGTYPTVSGTCGQVYIYTGIGKILGFNSGPYPSIATGLSTVQTVANGNSLISYMPFPAQGSSINGIVIRCSLCKNAVYQIDDLLTTLPINATYGSNINYINPNPDNYVSCKSGSYNNFTIRLYDQTGAILLPMLDPNILITINIKFNR